MVGVRYTFICVLWFREFEHQLSASCAGCGVEGEAKASPQLDLPRRPQAQNERRDVRRLHDRAAYGQFQRLSIRNALDIEHLDAIVRWGGDQ